MNKNKYPRYISTDPTGDDLLEGKSQEKISAAMAEHILYIDSLPEKDKLTPKMPRVIGLEGEWGSGKSNVLHRLQYTDLLKEPTYKFFTYDAWANQEDLQRRTILERLTAYLIDDRRLLKDKVTVCMQKPDEYNEFHSVDVEVTWKEKLDLLMAKRVKNITRSVSPLNTEFKLLMFTLALTPLLITLMNALKFENVSGWWYFGATILVALLPALITALTIAFKKEFHFSNAIKAYQSSTEDKTTHQVVNESEPSIQEFATWMKQLSVGLKEFKLIVVFDNMDRLPADKVKKLWSAIHSIFATEKYKNIWCIIPYDFDHLSCAFGTNEEERERLTKYFIDKSFPIVYRVPKPVVIDYKKIFGQFFSQAFDTTVNEVDAEIINRCYRVTNPKPNIRAIISFINRMVTLSNVYGSSVTPVSIAIFLLKEDEMLKHPTLNTFNQQQLIKKEVTTDQYILANAYINGFEKIVQDKNNLQKEIAALVYGIDPERAYQLPMHNALESCFTDSESKTSLNGYVKHPLFASVLTEVVHKIDPTHYQNVSIKLAELTDVELPEESKSSLKQIWNYLADRYIYLKQPVQSYSSLEKNILNHVGEQNQKQVANVFCTFFMTDENVKGDVLFNTLLELYNEPFAENWDINEICPKTSVTAEVFVAYVLAGEYLYKQFPIYTEPEELNKYLSDKLYADEDYTEVIQILSTDKNYHVQSVADRAIEEFEEHKAPYSIAVRLLNIAKIFFPKADINPSLEYLQSLWQQMKQEEKDPAHPSNEYKELYALYAVSYPGNLQGEPQFTSKDMAERVLFYCTTSKIIQLAIQHPGDSAIQGLLFSSLINKVTDSNPAINGGFVTKWNTLIGNNPNISISHLFEFAETWMYNTLSADEEAKTIEQLLPLQNWFDDLLQSDSRIAHDLIVKAIADVKKQPEGVLYNMQNLAPTNGYWYNLFVKLIMNDKIANPIGEMLDGIVVKALQLYAKNNNLNSQVIQKLLDLGFENYARHATAVNDIRRKIFLRSEGYLITPQNYPVLHRWLERAGINESGHINDSADTILAPIVDDDNCQKIILANKSYYQPIVTGSKDSSSALHDKLRRLVKSDSESEFKQFINNIVQYDSEEDR